VNRLSYPVGQANVALLKALDRALAAAKGRAAADGWLRAIRMVPGDLDDETRLVPLPALHHALAVFAETTSRDAIPGVWPHLIAPDNLGLWVRALRGTTMPAEAFARLDANESEYGRTARWETLEARRGLWRGRVSLAHDPALEEDGLLRLLRLAELRAVPALYGFENATARMREPDARSLGVAQEFEVVWHAPDARRTAAAGSALGALAGAVPLAASLLPVAPGMAMIAAVAAAGGLAGMSWAQGRARRAASRAQGVRMQALERGLSLRESRGKEMGATLEGSVVAGQFRIVRRMGAGATGVIYEAERISDGMPVALKLLRAAAAHEAVASDRLRREAEALGLSWHPNVVEVIDHGHLADGTAYLVMELLRGESLATRLATKGRLTPADVLPIAMQVCDALAAVHAAGVVHRDLKPSNVYLAIDREDPAQSERVKLLDFGIARVEWEETRITNTGGPLGTQGYMSPEQEGGHGDVDGRSDIFSLGAMIYECLVGQPPPLRASSGPVPAAEHTSIPFESGTHEAAALVPPVWRVIIEKAMQPSPADRYEDARAFAQALRAAREEIAAAEASSQGQR
jgi:eukaryotic-like serine/threonine-protein kinase